MKRSISFAVVLVLVLTSFTVAFAAVPADVSGQICEEAVSTLMSKGVVNGYPDGTFKPEAQITRAEACLIVVKSMKPGTSAINASAQSNFSDLAGYDWAKPYINYAAASGVINGYPDGTFHPGAYVTYNEMAAMLVRALGFEAADLPGVWPVNFTAKAEALGIFTGITYQGNMFASRCHVAQMDYRVVDAIEAANVPDEDTGTTVEEPTYADLAGPLATFSGRAYGIVLELANILNDDGDVVQQIEFLFGNKTLYLNTDDEDTVAVPTQEERDAGYIYALKMRNGIVQDYAFGDKITSFEGIGVTSDFESLTGTSWSEVYDKGDGVVQIGEFASFREANVLIASLEAFPSSHNLFGNSLLWISYLDDASIYVAVQEDDGSIKEYEAGTARDIKVGSYIKMFSVTGDEPGVAEIILVAPEKPRIEKN